MSCVDSTLTLRAEPVEGDLPCNTRQQTMPVGAHKYMSVTEAAAESALLGDMQPQQTSDTQAMSDRSDRSERLAHNTLCLDP